MWFKNIFVFAFTRSFTWTLQQLEQALGENKYYPCSSNELSRLGWVSPFGKYNKNLAYDAQGNVFICARSEEKIIPASVIKDALDQKIEQLEHEQGRTASKKEKEQFKEDIIFELLPRAFSRKTDIHAYINTELNIIVINTSSRSKAELLLAMLRKTLGTLPVTSFSPKQAPDEVITKWLTDKNISTNFSLGQEAQFNALGDSAPIHNVKNQDMQSQEIKQLLSAEMFANKVRLNWLDQVDFTVCDDLSIKRIKFSDDIQDHNNDIDKDDVDSRIEADAMLMAYTLNVMVNELLDEFLVSPIEYLEEDKAA